jgi:hypothetical protein
MGRGKPGGRSSSFSLVDLKYFERFRKYLYEPVDNVNLIWFRIGLGLMMAYLSYTYLQDDFRKMEDQYMRSDFYPKYYLFEWVRVLRGQGMYYVISVMLCSSIGILLGMAYRLSSIIFFICWTYLMLLDSSLYSDETYLIFLMSFLMIFLPGNQDLSIDAWISKNPRPTHTIPRYILLLLQIHQVRDTQIFPFNQKHKIF